MKVWSKKETKVLERFYANTTNDTLSYVMGRSTDSIRKKARKLGLYKVNVRDSKLRSRSGISIDTETIMASLGSF